MPKVSVIIPTYNRAATLAAAISSVLNQTEKDLEVLVCDDGSTDNSREIVMALANFDNRVKWLELGYNSGLPAVPRNLGIKQASGEWLAFLDSDDEWLPEKLSQQLIALANSSSLACATNAFLSDDSVMLKLKEENKIINFRDLISNNKIVASSVLLSGLFFRKDKLFFSEDIKLKAVEDYDLWLRVAVLSNFIYLEQPLVRYNDSSPDSIRTKQPLKSFLQKRKIMWSLFQYLNEQKKFKEYFFCLGYQIIINEFIIIKASLGWIVRLFK